MAIIHSTAYRFIALEPTRLGKLRQNLIGTAQACNLKGTILLSLEGINLSLAGTLEDMAYFKDCLNDYLPDLKDLHYLESSSNVPPFQKLYVKLKKQIIPFPDLKVPELQGSFQAGRAPYLSPVTFKTWLQTGYDMVVLDTRNEYEVVTGSFQNALSLNMRHFRDFPQKAQNLPQAFKQKPVVTFCTGGIRCEKAATFLIQQGFEQVYQLEKGILHYFECCGSACYQGGCFVFDERQVVYANTLLDRSNINRAI